MAEETAITLPVLHLNGTGGQTLEEGYGEAAKSLNDFEEAFKQIEFNRRDYYVHPDPEAWDKALLERTLIFAKVAQIREYIDKHREHIFDNTKH